MPLPTSNSYIDVILCDYHLEVNSTQLRNRSQGIGKPTVHQIPV
jgi:hypothetical protein